MSALARWCYQHRFVVIAAWVALLIGLAVMSQAVKTTYDNSLIVPGTSSGRAQELLLRSAPAQAGDSDQIVWQVSQGRATDPAVEQRMSAMLTQVSHLPQVASVASPYLPGGKVQVSADGRTAYATLNFTKTANDLDPADIRRVIVPSVMYLCGPANWWLPGWLDRCLPHLALEPPMEEQPVHVPGPALV
ncbi:hypothetical protein ACWD6R_21725 [Streptomyces sp. NPDC005151]